MHRNARRGACVLLLSLLALAAASQASASWSSTGSGQGAATTAFASQSTPVVATPTCTWNSTTKVLTVTVTWSKSSYALSNVQRTDVAAGTTVTLATGLASSVTSYTETNTVNVSGKFTTGSYTYTITATAGSFWSRSGTSAPKAFTLASGKTGDTCT